MVDLLGFCKLPLAGAEVGRESPTVIVPAVVAPENSTGGAAADRSC